MPCAHVGARFPCPPQPLDDAQLALAEAALAAGSQELLSLAHARVQWGERATRLLSLLGGVTRADLSGHVLGPAQVLALAAALGSGARLRHLTLRGCALGDEQLRALMAGGAPLLEALDVAANRLTSLEPLCACGALRSLDASCNPLTQLWPWPRGLERLVVTQLPALPALGHGCELGALRELHLEGARVAPSVGEALSRAVAASDHVVLVAVAGGLEPEARARLASNRALAVPAHVPAHPCPARVELCDVPVALAPLLAALAERSDAHANLTLLRCDAAGVDDAAVTDDLGLLLERARALHTLSLCDNALTNDSARRVVSWLRASHAAPGGGAPLRACQLYGNVGVEALWHTRVALAVARQPEAAAHVAEAAEAAQQLPDAEAAGDGSEASSESEESWSEEDEAWDVKGDAPQVLPRLARDAGRYRHVFARDCSAADVARVLGALDAGSVRALRLSSCALQPWPTLPRMGRLRVLNLACNGLVSVDSAALLDACPALRWLSLEGNPGLGDVGVLALFEFVVARAPRLRHVSVRRCGIAQVTTVAALRRVVEQCPQLTSVDLDDNPAGGSAPLAALLSERDRARSAALTDEPGPDAQPPVAPAHAEDGPAVSATALRMEAAALQGQLRALQDIVKGLRDDNATILELHNKLLMEHAELHLNYEDAIRKAGRAGVVLPPFRFGAKGK